MLTQISSFKTVPQSLNRISAPEGLDEAGFELSLNPA